MSSFTLKLKTDNAAFGDDPGIEVARILQQVASDVGDLSGRQIITGTVRDVNGNMVGIWQIRGR